MQRSPLQSAYETHQQPVCRRFSFLFSVLKKTTAGDESKQLLDAHASQSNARPQNYTLKLTSITNLDSAIDLRSMFLIVRGTHACMRRMCKLHLGFEPEPSHSNILRKYINSLFVFHLFPFFYCSVCHIPLETLLNVWI